MKTWKMVLFLLPACPILTQYKNGAVEKQSREEIKSDFFVRQNKKTTSILDACTRIFVKYDRRFQNSNLFNMPQKDCTTVDTEQPYPAIFASGSKQTPTPPRFF